MFKQLFLSERKIMAVILLNAVLIFTMYFPKFHGSFWLEFLDQCFILFFIVEAAVKMYYLKPSGYFGFWWNRFDFAILLLSLPALLVPYIELPDTSAILLLRMFRLVRLVRFIRFIPNLDQVMEGLSRALKASVFVLVALFVLDFLLALFTCHFYGEVAAEYFGDPLIAAYSIFQLFTVEGWNEISADVITQLENPFAIGITRLYFIIVVLSGGIFGLSLANAVFVDEMTIDNNRVLEEKVDRLQEQIAELKALLEERKRG